MSRAAGPAGLPRHLDLRSRLTPVRWQGLGQTCLAFAATAGHELLRHGTLLEPLAPEFLVHGAVRQGADLRRGIRIAAVRTTLTTDGQCLERLFPFDAGGDKRRAGYGPSVAAATDAGLRLVTDHQVLANPTIDDARRAAAAGAATVIGIEYFGSARILGPDSLIPLPDPAEPTLGRHALVVAGYDDARAALLVRNSWGEGWGDRGYAWFPYSYPALFLHELWTLRL